MSAIAPYNDTARIGPLREAVKKLAGLNVPIGEIVQFQVVVDANAVVADLMCKVRYPERGATALEEMIKATVVVAHAPRWLEQEMASAISQAAVSSKLPAVRLWECWKEYGTLLTWDETLREPGAAGGECCDPKDLPYVELARKIGADGILTKDRHIAKLGGHTLSHEFVLGARGYARAILPAVSVRVLGVVMPVATVAALVEMTRGLARGVGRLPDPVKAILLASAVVALAHPESRKWIVERCTSMGAVLSSVSGVLMDFLSAAATLHNESRASADSHLAIAAGLVRPRHIAKPVRRTPRRRAGVPQPAARALPKS